MAAPVPISGTSRWGSASGEELNGRTPADVLALAERVLGFAEKESPTEVEVMAMADDGSLTRFANSEIHQNVAESNAQVNLRFVTGKRVGVALDEPVRRRGTPPPGRAGCGDRPQLRRSSRMGRPPQPDTDPARAGGLLEGDGGRLA